MNGVVLNKIPRYYSPIMAEVEEQHSIAAAEEDDEERNVTDYTAGEEADDIEEKSGVEEAAAEDEDQLSGKLIKTKFIFSTHTLFLSKIDFSSSTPSSSTDCKLFVGNLTFKTGASDLRELFSKYGTVVEARVAGKWPLKTTVQDLCFVSDWLLIWLHIYILCTLRHTEYIAQAGALRMTINQKGLGLLQ